MSVSKPFRFLALGARVIRGDSGDVPQNVARNLELHVSGGEFNVAANLHLAFGVPSGLVSARVTNHPWGDMVQESTPWGMTLHQKEFAHNGVNGPNIAFILSDRAAGIRNPKVFYNRANEAAALLKPGDFDFERIFEEDNIGWAHCGGIFCALSETTPKLALEFLSAAKAKGIRTSFDLNYRGLLWDLLGGKSAAQKVLHEIVGQVDVLVGNEEDLQLSLGLRGPEVGKKDALDSAVFGDLVAQVQEKFPGVMAVATTLRHVHQTNWHDWGMALWLKNSNWPGAKPHDTAQELYMAPERELFVVDRIGGGDGAAAGLFYALMNPHVPEWAVDEAGAPLSFGDYAVRMAAAHGGLLTSTKGDTTGVKLADVIHIAKGGSARVAR